MWREGEFLIHLQCVLELGLPAICTAVLTPAYSADLSLTFCYLFPFQAHSCHRSWLRPSQSKWNDSLKCMNFISFPSRMLLCSRQSLVLPQVTIPFGVAVLFLKKGPYSVLFPGQSLPDYILFNDEGHLKCFFPTKAKPQGGASCKF